MKKWTEEIDNFIRAEIPLPFYPYNTKVNLVNLINAIFDTNFTKHALTTNCTSKRIQLGIKPYQANTGKFRGREPLPVWTERKVKGYWRIKIAQPNVWMIKKHWVWNQAHPEQPVKPGDNILSLDGDADNFDIENLAYLPKRLVAVFQHCGGTVKGNPEVTKLNLLKAQLKMAALDAGEKAGLVKQYNGGRGFIEDFNQKAREMRHRYEASRTPEQMAEILAKRRAYYLKRKDTPEFKAKRKEYMRRYEEKKRAERRAKKELKNDRT